MTIESKVMEEELFGPILPILKIKTPEEVLNMTSLKVYIDKRKRVICVIISICVSLYALFL